MVDNKMITQIKNCFKNVAETDVTRYGVGSLLNQWEKNISPTLKKTFADQLIYEKEHTAKLTPSAMRLRLKNRIEDEVMELVLSMARSDVMRKIFPAAASICIRYGLADSLVMNVITASNLRTNSVGLPLMNFLRRLAIEDEGVTLRETPGRFSLIIRREEHEVKIVVTEGMKLMKYLGQIGKVFNLTSEVNRIISIYSSTKNDISSSGKLCLSIHPMDYLTMSNNASGWSTCQNIRTGCYRAGVLEHMVSGYVVVAYLKSNTETFSDWNSKRWRQLLFVTDELITASTAYPYESDELTEESMKWLVELIREKTDVNYHEPKLLSPVDQQDSNYKIYTTYAHNDFAALCDSDDYGTFYGNGLCFDWTSVRKGVTPFSGEIYEVYRQGEVICPFCGEERYDEDQGELLCSKCLMDNEE